MSDHVVIVKVVKVISEPYTGCALQRPEGDRLRTEQEKGIVTQQDSFRFPSGFGRGHLEESAQLICEGLELLVFWIDDHAQLSVSFSVSESFQQPCKVFGWRAIVGVIASFDVEGEV